MKVVAIIQARMTSTRLPGKVLLDLAGRPMLDRVATRVRRARLLTSVGVATSTDSTDDAIDDFCAAAKIPCVRGSLDDVLGRYYLAMSRWDADVVVRITADCPLVDPDMIDLAVESLGSDIDYVSTELPLPTYPRGLDVEVIAAAALSRAWEADRDPVSREHVTPYLYRHPQLFRLRGIPNPVDYSHHRWTVDTAEDMELVQRIYRAFGRDDFKWLEVIELLAGRPDLVLLNQHVRQNVVC